MNEESFEILRGHVAGLQLLMTQAWVIVLQAYPRDRREGLIQDLLIELEKRFGRVSPLAQRAALESAEGMLDTALRTLQKTEQPPEAT